MTRCSLTPTTPARPQIFRASPDCVMTSRLRGKYSVPIYAYVSYICDPLSSSDTLAPKGVVETGTTRLGSCLGRGGRTICLGAPPERSALPPPPASQCRARVKHAG